VRALAKGCCEAWVADGAAHKDSQETKGEQV